MALLKSIYSDTSRKLFMIFFALSSLIPMFIVSYILYEYIFPLLGEGNAEDVKEVVLYGLLLTLVLALASFFIMSRWIRSFEGVTHEIHQKTREVSEGRADFSAQSIAVHEDVLVDDVSEEEPGPRKNELRILVDSFNSIFQTAADQIAERQRLKEMLANLIAIASDLTAELDFDRLFPLIIGEVTKVMAAERSTLYVVDRERRELWTKVAEGIESIRVPFGKGISGRVAETGETINVRDAWTLPFFDRTYDEKHRFRTQSVLCVPINSRNGERIGVLQVINKRGKPHFGREDELFMRAMVAQVGIALENSLLVEEIVLSFRSFIVTLSATVDARHPVTAGHSERVTAYSLCIARHLDLTATDMEQLRYAALLHDIGKIGICDEVLLKNGPYTAEERAVMNTHPAKAKTILENFRFPRNLMDIPEIACRHHERHDGSGYPDGLSGDRIPLASRVIAVADVFDALTSRREYPKYAGDRRYGCDPLPLGRALDIIRDGAGSQFDPSVVAAFFRCLPDLLSAHRGDFSPLSAVDECLRKARLAGQGKAGLAEERGSRLPEHPVA